MPNTETIVANSGGTDHPLLRESEKCPLGKHRKGTGLLVCWPCFRQHNLSMPNPVIESRLDQAEKDERLRRTARGDKLVLPSVTTAELAAILAGLRLLDAETDSILNANINSQRGGIREIWNEGDVAGPGCIGGDIDDLCERLNMDSVQR